MNYILMNKDMTKAILDGRKTQTRRVMLGCNTFNITCEDGLYNLVHNYKMSIENVGLFSTKEKLVNWFSFKYAKYKIGETIWVREPARVVKHAVDCDGDYFGTYLEYKTDGKQILLDTFDEYVDDKKWYTHCEGIPNGCIKEMARIFLKITNVRVERLQDISTQDMIKEGLPKSLQHYILYDRRDLYLATWWIPLWNKTAPKGYRWEDDPYVIVYEFERVK